MSILVFLPKVVDASINLMFSYDGRLLLFFHARVTYKCNTLYSISKSVFPWLERIEVYLNGMWIVDIVNVLKKCQINSVFKYNQ